MTRHFSQFSIGPNSPPRKVRRWLAAQGHFPVPTEKARNRHVHPRSKRLLSASVPKTVIEIAASVERPAGKAEEISVSLSQPVLQQEIAPPQPPIPAAVEPQTASSQSVKRSLFSFGKR